MGNLEKLAKYGTEDEEKQSKNTTQYVLDITIYMNLLQTTGVFVWLKRRLIVKKYFVHIYICY